MDRIKVGVIGVGSMGSNHLRLYSELHDFELLGFYDPSADCAKYADLYDTRSYNSPEALIAEADALSIAAPSSLHLSMALKCAQANKHSLIEKPITTDSKSARDILDAFRGGKAILMCGHVERFNPVVQELQKILANSEIIAIEARRCSPWNGRINDVDVMFDLMIHDMDIVINALCTEEIESMSAAGNVVNSDDMLDYAHAVIRFNNGVLASVTSSRVTEDKIREINVHTRDAFIRADLLHRTLTITRRTSYDVALNGSAPLYRQENVTERVFVAQVEPLRQELLHFAHCIRTGQTPVVNGESSTRALSAIEQAARQCYH